MAGSQLNVSQLDQTIELDEPANPAASLQPVVKAEPKSAEVSAPEKPLPIAEVKAEQVEVKVFEPSQPREPLPVEVDKREF